LGLNPEIKIKIRNLIIFLSFVIPFICHSSDNIHLNSGQIIECKILSIDTTTVTAEILESEIKRTFYKTEIKVIIYEDGTAEVFPNVEPDPYDELKQRMEELKVKTDKIELKEAKAKGLATGVAICCVIIFILAFI